ncbi:hypothetical protein CUT44_22560 [Streptomyces carminius]|uniref:Uncharacterized protein n=1 Tax=Streptomyces carminius TaxID=2665496 RepID=A0A2M8LUC1_9ACTN|nr:hypothetical protein [Streptomyces carminius]PJE95553.1 hypothetical protein CUT44_22560 [Streptomyces carminius]
MARVLTALLLRLFPPSGRHRRTTELEPCVRCKKPGHYGAVHWHLCPPCRRPDLQRRTLLRTNRAVLAVPGGHAPPPRPYLHPHQVQEQRRRALELALDGIDVGPEIIHGMRVAV